jgi:hypothetical protein
VKNENTFKLLLDALFDLNKLLIQNNSSIELTIVGSMAIYLNGLELNRMTEDIDYINYSATAEFLSYTKIIEKKYNLPTDWINSRAQDIEPLPSDIEKKLKFDNRFSHIKLKFIDIDTAIEFKVYAYYIRALDKDLSDLRVLKPTKDQINAGINYTKTQIKHHHGQAQLIKDETEINRFWEFLIHELRI